MVRMRADHLLMACLLVCCIFGVCTRDYYASTLNRVVSAEAKPRSLQFMTGKIDVHHVARAQWNHIPELKAVSSRGISTVMNPMYRILDVQIATKLITLGALPLIFFVLAKRLMQPSSTEAQMISLSGFNFDDDKTDTNTDRFSEGGKWIDPKYRSDPYNYGPPDEEDLKDDTDSDDSDREVDSGEGWNYESRANPYQPTEEDKEIRDYIKNRIAAERAAGATQASSDLDTEAEPDNELEDEKRFLRSLNYKSRPRGNGIVKYWSDYYGYGFILPYCNGKDLFVHATDIHSDPATGYRDLAVGELVWYDVEVDAEGKARATNVTGLNGAYVEGRRGGGITLDEDDIKPKVAPKKKGAIRDFTESKYWSTERAPMQESFIIEKVPPVPGPKVKWWED